MIGRRRRRRRRRRGRRGGEEEEEEEEEGGGGGRRRRRRKKRRRKNMHISTYSHIRTFAFLHIFIIIIRRVIVTVVCGVVSLSRWKTQLAGNSLGWAACCEDDKSALFSAHVLRYENVPTTQRVDCHSFGEYARGLNCTPW